MCSSNCQLNEQQLEQNKQIFDFSKQNDLCDRCCLRNLGEIYSQNIFNQSDIDVKSRLNELLGINDTSNDEENSKSDESNSKRLVPNYCFCCLGVLQKGCQSDFLEKIVDQIEASGYKFSKFQINLFLPIAITLRENFINAKFLNRFSDLKHRISNNYTVKDVYRFVLIRRISKRTDARFDAEAQCEILVHTSYQHSNLECMQLLNQTQSKQLNHTSIIKAITQLGLNKVLKLQLFTPSHCFRLDEVKVVHHPLFLIGRYNKYARGISQTPWLTKEGIRKFSVEEFITNVIIKHVPCEATKFSASGREDVDVRMLGRGRPFTVELENPKCLTIDPQILVQIEQEIKLDSDENVCVRDLQLGQKDDVAHNLKEGESDKRKQYTALCICSRPLTQLDLDRIAAVQDLKIFQKTPIRVLHRRSLATRQRLIYSAKVDTLFEDKYTFRLNLETEAGTYVKEFVHGDFGRTQPNLSTVIGDCQTDILELDVTDICMDWPPKIDRA